MCFSDSTALLFLFICEDSRFDAFLCLVLVLAYLRRQCVIETLANDKRSDSMGANATFRKSLNEKCIGINL